MLKNLLRTIAQRMLGLQHYLLVFSWVSGLRLRKTAKGREFRHFISLIPQAGIVLDLGANIGITTITLAKARPGCHILAFEPVPPSRETLVKLTEWYRLKNVTVLPYALGNKSQTVQITVPRIAGAWMPGLSHISQMAGEKELSFDADMRVLDQLTELNDASHIVAIKLDVENYEYYVLSGALHILRQHRPVIYCELWNDERRQPCIDLLQGMGYHTSVFQHDELVEYNGQDSINFFFLPSLVKGR